MRRQTLYQSWFELHVACQELVLAIYVDVRRKLNTIKRLVKIGGEK